MRCTCLLFLPLLLFLPPPLLLILFTLFCPPSPHDPLYLRYSYIELSFSFTMDLYPFYPPVVTIVRPRFEGFMIGNIASLKCVCDTWLVLSSSLLFLLHSHSAVPDAGIESQPFYFILSHTAQCCLTPSCPIPSFFIMSCLSMGSHLLTLSCDFWTVYQIISTHTKR